MLISVVLCRHLSRWMTLRKNATFSKYFVPSAIRIRVVTMTSLQCYRCLYVWDCNRFLYAMPTGWIFFVRKMLISHLNCYILFYSQISLFFCSNPRLTLTGHNRLRYDTSNIENFHIKPLDEYFIGAKREGTYMEKYAYQLHDLLRKTFECDPEKRIKMGKNFSSESSLKIY